MRDAARRLGHPLAPEDAAGAASILAESFPTPEQAWDARAIADLVRDGAILIAAPDGLAMIRVVADEAEVLTIAVRPAARGRGLGAVLLADAIAAARETGAARAFLEVADGNAAARALYHGAGFAEAGRRRGYYRAADGGREDALILALDLTD
jgi:ribosomal-protein-alanine N-acetyltransferase